MSNPNPQVDTAALFSSPALWLGVLAADLARGDREGVRHAQARLQDLGWLVLAPGDLEQLIAATEPTDEAPSEPRAEEATTP
jgi:hypothetical protein